MRYYNFWCISFVLSEFFKHVQKTRKSREKVCSFSIFHQKPEKTLLRDWKSFKIAFFLFPPLFQTIVDKSLETLLHFWGVFQFTQVQPLPSPHKQCWTRVSRIFFRGSTLYKVEGGITARKFRKGLTALRGNRKMTEKYKCCSNVPRTFVHNCSLPVRQRVPYASLCLGHIVIGNLHSCAMKIPGKENLVN